MKEEHKSIIWLFIFIAALILWGVLSEIEIDKLTAERNQWKSNYMELWKNVTASTYADSILIKPHKPKLEQKK